MIKNVIIIIVLCALTGCSTIRQSQAIKVELKKTADTVLVSTTSEKTVVSITSKSGIGQANLIRIGDIWPDAMVIKLKLTSLEGFGMNNGFIYFNTWLKNSKPAPYWKVGTNQRQQPSPDGTIEVKFVKSDQWINVTMPPEMIKGNPGNISISWIDWYRD